MTEDTRLSPEKIKDLQKRIEQHSRKAHAYYTVMHEVRQVMESDDAASAWMETPLSDFGGETPARLVGEGRTDEVLTHIASLGSRAAR